ncbi:hypothetical protein GCM10010345_59750 [Streptomyces canarius]|uniref:Uncharacterized protein n=1 Tax=Streptomyces canarius TaxID=285453 RepID=A0ABQ3CYV8_9ACTN|nr:hypothetical protein GCM10010345_59750 [Streptomyces canarius]
MGARPAAGVRRAAAGADAAEAADTGQPSFRNGGIRIRVAHGRAAVGGDLPAGARPLPFPAPGVRRG